MTQASSPMDWMFNDPIPEPQHNAHVETARWSKHDAHWQEWDWLRRKAAYLKKGVHLIRPGYVPVDSLVVQPMFDPAPISPILTDRQYWTQ